MMWNEPFGWGAGGWLWPLHFLIPLLILGIFITLIVVLVRSAAGWGDYSPRLERRSPALDALEERARKTERDVLGLGHEK